LGYLFASGFFHVSIFWLLLCAVSIYLADRQSQERLARFEFFTEATRSEKDAILARLGNDLPSWVHFPDKERAEFVNKIVQQAWSHAKPTLAEFLTRQIESILNQNSNEGIKVNELIIGDLVILNKCFSIL
jgi:hypothetical protein